MNDKDELTAQAAAQQESSAAAQAKKPGWRELLSQRNPDLNIDDEDALSEYLGSTLGEYDDLRRSRQQFNDMLSDPRAAGVITGIATGVDADGNPFSFDEYMANNYLEDWAAGLSPDEIARRAKEREAARIKERADRVKQDEDTVRQVAANQQQTDELLTQAIQEANVDEARVREMLSWLYGDSQTPGMADRAADFTLTKDDWLRLLHAFNRDADLSSARQEGARATHSRRPSHRDLSSLPTDTGAGGGQEPSGSTEDPTAEVYGRMKRRY
jgi:hypothetical protein